MAQGFSLKDQLINPEKVSLLAGWLAPHLPDFDKDAFEAKAISRLPELELKARIFWLSEVLEMYLPTGFEAAAQVIHKALPPELDPAKTDDDFGDFIIDPFGQFVARNGLDDLHTSLPLLHALTRRFSMEFAIRPFLIRHKTQMLAALTKWADDENYHVRRLVSEGSRPFLPWGERIRWDMADSIPLLDKLFADRTRYVTRSVANHLNDIAKSNPDLVIRTLDRWRNSGRQDDKEMAWMTRHACRTLVKQGHPEAMNLLGFRPDPMVNISDITVDPQNGQVPINSALSFAFDVIADRDEPVIVDYVITFQRAGGKTSEKVFKLKQVNLKQGVPLNLSKKHHFKGDATTFRLYPGMHSLTVQMNGQPVGHFEFELV